MYSFLPDNIFTCPAQRLCWEIKEATGACSACAFLHLPQGEPMEHSCSEPWHGCELGVAHLPPWHCRSPVNIPCPTATLQVAGVARISLDPGPLRTDRTMRQALELLQNESCFYYYSCACIPLFAFMPFLSFVL